MKWHNVSKHYSEASAQEMQRREAKCLTDAAQEALDAVYDLQTALIRLEQTGGDAYLDNTYGGRGYKMSLRAILKIVADEIEREI